jgi:predicted nucleic acid-binding protein
VTVLDTGALVDYLLDGSAAGSVAALLEEEGELAAPDLVVFEAIAVLRRLCLRGELSERRAGGAVSDLADVPLELFATLPLRDRAWEMKSNLSTADALFVALAERLGEPLLTRDAPLAAAVSAGAATTAQVILLEVT